MISGMRIAEQRTRVAFGVILAIFLSLPPASGRAADMDGSTPSTGAPPVVDTWDFGVIQANRFALRVLSFDNMGGGDLRLGSVSSSHPAVVVDELSETVPPRQTGTARVLVLPRGPGEIDALLEIEAAPGGPLRYRVRGRVVPATAPAVEDGRSRAMSAILRSRLRISPADAKARIADGADAPAVVDVRKAGASARSRIPGALSLSLAEVRSSRWLKGRDVILVDDGLLDAAALDECRKIRGTGRRAWVARGGFDAWRRAGCPVESDAAGRICQVASSDLCPAIGEGGWLVVDITSSQGAAGRAAGLAPHPLLASLETVSVPADSGADAIASKLKEIQNGSPSGRRLLVMSFDGSGYLDFERHVAAAAVPNAYYLQGGAREFSLYASRFLSGGAARLQSVSGKCSCVK